MRGVCARPWCDEPAGARLDFDGEARVVWIDEPDPHRPPAACELCAAHADALRPPLRWEVRDRRPARGVPRPAGARPLAAPLPVATVAAGTARPAAAVPSGSTAAGGRGWIARFDADDDLDGVLTPSSPLLARAFGARPPR